MNRVLPFNRRPKLDVSHIPGAVLDHRSPIWWGNLLMLFIETSMFAMLIGSYFYYRINFNQWPPPRVELGNILYDARPYLKIPTINLIVILLGCIPMFIADRAALRMSAGIVKIGVAVAILFGLVAIALRFQEFEALKFKWNDNAYGSITWALLGVHLTHLILGTAEDTLMLVWMLIHGMDKKHARDVRVTAVYWYWIAAIWVLIYAVVFLGPRFYG
jgi:heme/copper-type cytochrome/quinol oxidase subunit 3